MKQANKYIEFQVELSMAPAKAMGASMGVDFNNSESNETSSSQVSDDSGYKEITEDDLPMLLKALGG